MTKNKDPKTKFFSGFRFSDENIELIEKTRKALGLTKTEYITKAVEEFNYHRNLSGRPSELEEFYFKHGKPLEVGMGVIFNDDFLNAELEVVGMGFFENNSPNIWVLANSKNGEFCGKRFSPLDLTPIL